MLSSVKSPCYITQRKKSSTNKNGQDESRMSLPLRDMSINEIHQNRPLLNSTMKSAKNSNLSSASNSSIRTIKSATDFDLSSESGYNLLSSSSTSVNNSSLKRASTSKHSISDRSHFNSSRQLSTNSSRNLSHNASSLSSRSRSYLGSESYGNISRRDHSQYHSTSRGLVPTQNSIQDLSRMSSHNNISYRKSNSSSFIEPSESYGNISQRDRSQYHSTSRSLVPTQNSIQDLSRISSPNNTTYIKSNSSTLMPSIMEPSGIMESPSYKGRAKCTVTETRRKIVVSNVPFQIFQDCDESGSFSDINSIVGAAVKNGNAKVSVEYTKEQRKYIIQ